MAVSKHTRRRGRARKIAACLVAAWCSATCPAAIAAEGPIYDVFAKALAPIAASAFGGAPGQPGAMVIEGTVNAASGKLAAARGARLRLALQAPDRLRADVVHHGTLLTASRSGRELWASPAGPMRELAKAAGIDVQNAEPDPQPIPLIPIGLDPQMLVFLPVVFDVQDLGLEEVDGTVHRGLEFSFLPELRKAIRAEDFTARAWITPGHTPRRVTVSGEDYSIDISIDKIDFAEKLPDAAWEPAEGQDVLRLPASALSELFERMLGQKFTLPGDLVTELPIPLIGQP